MNASLLLRLLRKDFRAFGLSLVNFWAVALAVALTPVDKFWLPLILSAAALALPFLLQSGLLHLDPARSSDAFLRPARSLPARSSQAS
ncbi:MAG: hypothetical protein M3463_04770 [Verrucomicrobiota bacterium]|nr:hypothetical protein [Verrucomicrobiota bacterium]